MNNVLQFLLGETKIDSEQGHYILDIQDEGDSIQVTVDYHNQYATAGLQHNCLFNETYSTDSHGENPFSLEQLSADLDAQHLESVDDWIVSFVESKNV